jgi:acyl-CoA synthetase (AMP-forming)/AMP-acid ligase II/carbon monoxide dehydrogenase subunit G
MRFREGITIDRAREEVWELILHPELRARILPWVSPLAPEDPQSEAAGELQVGTRFRTRIQVGSAKLAVLAEVIELDPARDVVLTTVTGVEIRLRLRLRDEGAACTRVTVRFSYNAPGVLLGSLAELLSAPMISANMRDSLRRLKRVAESDDPHNAVAVPALQKPNPVRRVAHEAVNVGILMRSGMVAPMRPDKVARLAWNGLRWGATPAMGVIAGAIRHPDRPMLIDERGSLTYAEVDQRSNAVAAGFVRAGLREGDRLGLMCRDHRGFVEAAMAAGKLGVDVLLLNTSFAGPQLAEVCDREDVAALVYDEEFSELVGKAGRGRKRFLGWAEEGEGPRIEELAEEEDPSRRPIPGRASHVTILTSGTSGLPKGATRGDVALTLDPPAALLERMPLREGDRMRICAPMFHAWGFSNFALGMALGDTFVLRRRFDPEEALRDIEAHGCQALVVVPVMLSRILELPEEVRERYDTSSLRAVCASGSALPGDLATRWMDAFGENLYNMYGSTEVAAATLATPADMRAAPGTAGRPARGTIVKLYDEQGAEVPQGETGRIFVGNSMLFSGYSGGGSKDVIDGLMSSGDIGRFDEAGRLFVQGRDDEMIVSGGENVFPKEVEDTLAQYQGVSEVAAIGVEDEKFGQRLRAFVVLDDGATVTEDALKQHVKENLARYKVPREIVFLDELPRNPTGKILKRELQEMELEPETH